jgi:hypothetical protein
LHHYRLLKSIRWFESLKALPAKAVKQKLEKMGFKLEDFLRPDESLKLINVSADPWLNKCFKAKDIEIRLLKSRKPTPQELEEFKRLKHVGKAWVLSPFDVPRFLLGPGWIALTSEDVKGYQIVGAYKELLRLYQVCVNQRLQGIKEAWPSCFASFTSFATFTQR